MHATLTNHNCSLILISLEKAETFEQAKLNIRVNVLETGKILTGVN